MAGVRPARAAEWLRVWPDLGPAWRTIDAYALGPAEYLQMCEREDIDPVAANRAHIAAYVRELTSRPSRRGANVMSIDSGAGPANATIQQRLVPVRLFYDHLGASGVWCRGRPSCRGYPPSTNGRKILAVAAKEPIRNRLMLALAYDAAPRREELCSLRTDDLDPARRMPRVRAETTKNRLERMVPYSAPTGVLLSGYLAHRAAISRARGPLFSSESRRNHAQPLSLWTWSKVVRRIALDAGVPRFSTHTTRHLCLTPTWTGWTVPSLVEAQTFHELAVGPPSAGAASRTARTPAGNIPTP